MPWILKRAPDKRHLQLTQTPGSQELRIQQLLGALPSLSGQSHTTLNRKAQNSVSATDTILQGHGCCRGRRKKEKNHTHTLSQKKKDTKSTHIVSNSHATLQQNAINIDFINTNKRIVSCFLRKSSQTMTTAKVTTSVRGEESEFKHFKYTTGCGWGIFKNHSLRNKFKEFMRIMISILSLVKITK